MRALRKIGWTYLIFGIGFIVGVGFTGVLFGMYGRQIDPSALPPVLAVSQIR